MAAAAAALPDLDLGFLDGLDLDLGSFDDLAEFCCLGDAVGADDDEEKGGLALCLSDFDSDDYGGSDGSGREGSPDSVVTDDYGEVPLSLSSLGPGDLDGGDSMSAYVSELERFLMEDDYDDDDVAAREDEASSRKRARYK